jgi:mono/diheme cytochrome c family protein
LISRTRRADRDNLGTYIYAALYARIAGGPISRQKRGFVMVLRILFTFGLASLLGAGLAVAGPVTTKPDPVHGKELAQQLCSNCHLVDSQQQQANADVPSLNEIANKEGQTAGTLMAHIVLPKHPMPTIPLTQSELADLAAYILSLRKSG